jgi:streptogramin lyase
VRIKSSVNVVPAAAFAVVASVAAGCAPSSHSDASDASHAPSASVSTIAKTGAFSEPYGLAIAPDGAMYFSDPQAQAVRTIAPDGSVTVAAGPATAGAEAPLAGAYADGPANSARFAEPQGLAVGSDGSIVIADRDNACVRRLRAGTVTTFAGRCGEKGTRDGPSATARFTAPVALAFDREGDLFVAQDGEAVREVDARGIVSTLHLPLSDGERSTGIAVGWSAQASSAETLFLADRAGILRVDLRTNASLRLPASVDSVHLSLVEGNNELGFPFGIAAIDDRTAAYTDARTNTVRLLQGETSSVLAGAAVFDPGSFSAGFADGRGSVAKFDAPTAIARRPGSNDLVVVDAGNHALRAIAGGIDDRANVSVSLSGLAPYLAAKPARTIAFVGNSFAWTDTAYADSIEGQMQASLCGGDPHACAVVPFALSGASVDAIAGFTRDTIADLGFRTVILQITSQFVTNYDRKRLGAALADAGAFDAYAKTLRELARTLALKNTRLVLVVTPQAYEISPSQALGFQNASQLYFSENAADAVRVHDKMLAAGKNLGIETIDLWPAFRGALSSDPVPALYDSADPHLNARGRALAAATIVNALGK